MKNLDIRKYAIFTIVCFLSFFGYRVYAAEAVVVTPGKPATLIGTMNYENAVCYVNNKQITPESEYNDGKYRVYYDDSKTDILIQSTQAGVGSDLSVFCTYDRHMEIVNSNKVEVGGKGDVTVSVSSFSFEGASRITLDMDEQFNSEYTITSWISNIGIMESVSINDARINTSACVAGTDTCKITLNSPVTSSGQVIGEIKYRDKDTGGQNTLTVIINIKDTWFLKADGGNYAKTCDFSSSLWEKRDGDSNVWYSKQGVDIAFNNVHFPSCEVDTDYNPLIEFKGWVYQKRDADLDANNAGLVNGNFQTVDYCTTVASKYPSLFGFVNAGQSVDPRDIHYGYVFACYASRGIALDMNGGTASLDGNVWKLYTSKDGLYSDKHGYNGLYTYTGGGNIALPSSVNPPAIYANTAEFVGWKNKKTGEVVPGGTTVNGNDGTIYTATFKQKGTSNGGSSGEVELGGYEIKTVFVGETSEIILQNGYTCTSYDSDNFSITNGGSVAGESRCKITGKASTNGQFINVPFVNTNGATFTYKIMVSTRDGLGGNLIIGNPTINIQINTDSLNNSNGGSGINASEGYGCQSFRVTKIRGDKSQTPLKSGDYQLDIMHYGLSCATAGYAELQYDSLCLDPGRTAPAVGDLYQYERRISPNWNDGSDMAQFDNAIAYLIFKTMNVSPKEDANGNNTHAYRKALTSANVAVRILEFVYNQDNGTNATQKLSSHYLTYLAIAANLKEKVRTGTVTYDDLVSATGGVSPSCEAGRYCLNEVAGNGQFSVIQEVVDLLNFRQVGKADIVISEMSHPKNEVKIDSIDGYIVNFSGKMTLPKASLVVPQQLFGQNFLVTLINRDANIKNAALTSQQCIEVDGHTECSYSGYVDTTPTGGVVPGGTNFAVKVAYKSNYSLDNAVLLKITHSTKIAQRFIAFNEHLEAFFYLNLSGSNNCNALIAAAGDSEENAQIAVNAGCCTVELQKTNPIFYNKYCRKNCTYDETYNLVDGSNDFVCTNQDQDFNSIKEATTTLNQENYACIVDVSAKVGTNASLNYQQALTATENMTDFRGNILSVGEYNSQNGVAGTGNPYCRVTCKEDWTFKTPGFSNFTGENAVKAGSYFTINQNMALASTKTCVTTYIDIDGYKLNLATISNSIMNATNEYRARAQAMSNRNITYEPHEYYTTYVRSGSEKNMVTCTAADADKEGCTTSTGYGTYQCPTGQCECSSTGWQLTNECSQTPSTQVTGQYQDGYKVTYKAQKATCNVAKLSVLPGTYYNRYNNYVYGSGNLSSSLAPIGSTNEVLSGFVAGDSEKTVVCTNEKCTAQLPDGTDANGNPKYKYVDDYIDINNNRIALESNGSCQTFTTETDAINALTPGLTYNGESLTGSMQRLSNEVNAWNQQAKIASDNFGKCQNFYIYNNRDVGTNSTVYGGAGAYVVVGGGDTNLQNSGSTVNISDLFDPVIKYKYDEETYMSYVGDNNTYILDKFNGASTNTYYYNVINPSTYSGQQVPSTLHAEQRPLCYVENGYTGNFDGAKMYCKVVNFHYYDAHYIKTELTQGGTFKNNVTWYTRQYGGIIYPGTGGSDEERLQNAKRNSGNLNDTMEWTRLGQNDVFPVQLNTRRNVYQYVFTFENIGTYMSGDKNHNSEQDLGRIMGSSTSVAMYNFNTCFYEVYEGMCLCCGRTMSSTARVENETNIDTTQYVPNRGNNYSNNTANSVNLNANGTLGFYTNSVSLSDLAGASNGFASSSNWGDKNEYFYNGNIYYTDKGSSLVSAIENKGETIYGDTPEYSYTLNPSALSAIRNMEHSKNYAVQTGDLTAMGSYKMQGGDASSDGASNVLLTHFKSNFLDKIKEYETAEYKGLLFTNKQMADKCYVTNAADVGNSNYKDCRWIDYMDDDGYRLVFK